MFLREDRLGKDGNRGNKLQCECWWKRLRPLLMVETYRLFGGTNKVIEPFMAAIEMIHTYSLVHDDLPAMDNDLYRRGKRQHGLSMEKLWQSLLETDS